MTDIARIRSTDVPIEELEELGDLIGRATGGMSVRDGDEVVVRQFRDPGKPETRRVTRSRVPMKLRGRHPVTWHPLKWLRGDVKVTPRRGYRLPLRSVAGLG